MARSTLYVQTRDKVVGPFTCNEESAAYAGEYGGDCVDPLIGATAAPKSPRRRTTGTGAADERP